MAGYNLLRDVEVGMSMEWISVEEYDKLKNKPENAVFYFKSSGAGSHILRPIIQTDRVFGNRVCTHYLPLPKAPNDK